MPRAGETIDEWETDLDMSFEETNAAPQQQIQVQEVMPLDQTPKKKHKLLKKSPKDIALPISLISSPPSETNIYPDVFLGDNEVIYFEDHDGQNADMIKIGAHYHDRQKPSTPVTFIGIVIGKKLGGSTPLPHRTGLHINVNYWILTIHATKKSLGLGLCPNTIVPHIGVEHPKCIRFKKDGSPRKSINGAMKYHYDSCSNSGITTLHTAPQRGILW
jgi:hypothetical protein